MCHEFFCVNDDIEKTSEEKKCSPCESGNRDLLIGGGVAAYGTTMAIVAGTVCPICVYLGAFVVSFACFRIMRAASSGAISVTSRLRRFG